MIGAGTIINPIIKVVTTVAILGAVYLLFVRPILDTTEDVVDRTAGQFEQFGGKSGQGGDLELSMSQSRAESYATTLQNSWPAGAREVRSCIRDAKGDAQRMDRCAEFGQTVAHTLQSDYNFANSYADSLAAQGRAGDAQRVRDCVDKAGFKIGPMERCRDLADKLLFG